MFTDTVIVELQGQQPEASRVQSLFSPVFTVIITLIVLPMAVADVRTCAHLCCRSLPQFLNTKVIVLIHHRHHVVRFGTVLLSKICPFSFKQQKKMCQGVFIKALEWNWHPAVSVGTWLDYQQCTAFELSAAPGFWTTTVHSNSNVSLSAFYPNVCEDIIFTLVL